MPALIKGFLGNSSGTAGIEYGVIAALLALVISGGLSAATSRISAGAAKLDSAFTQDRFTLPTFEARK